MKVSYETFHHGDSKNLKKNEVLLQNCHDNYLFDWKNSEYFEDIVLQED